MGVPGNANALLLRSAAAAGGYQVSRSLRFNSADSAHLNRTPASTGSQTTYTFSAWIKQCRKGNSADFNTTQMLFSRGNTFICIDQDNKIYANHRNGATNYFRISTAVYRDFSAWAHLVWTVNTPNATAQNRARIWINGTEITTWDANGTIPQNHATEINTTSIHYIGRDGTYGFYPDLYFADVHFVDGLALDPTSFAETDATTGQWIPKLYSGSYGTNGFKLTFADNSAATAAALGKDTSGNSNNWTPNNLSVTAGAGNDSLVDTPTSYGTDTGAGGEVRGNYCTWSPLYAPVITITNGNLVAAVNATTGYGSISVSSGKWYWEITPTNTVSTNTYIGIIDSTYIRTDSSWNTQARAYVSSGNKYDGSTSAYGASYASGDVIGVALDVDAGTLVFYKNGSTQGTAFNSGLTGKEWRALCYTGQSATHTANFGQRPFAYTAPSGFKALCDTNLGTPVVAKPNTVMDAVLYTGNGAARSITGLAFNPDLVWLKSRSAATDHELTDSVRGVTKSLSSNLTAAEATDTGGLTAFNSDGFSLGTNTNYNNNAATYVTWAWDAGTSTVSNTSGSITSSVRANASAGFSIATFTTQASGSGQTVGHGLGVAPSLIIQKIRNAGSTSWIIYHTSLGAGNYILFDTSASVASSIAWNSTSPTSSVWSLGTTWAGSYSAVAYCWTPVAGYSSFGSYTGNGSTDGPFVYTGHRSRWLMVKRTDTSGYPWVIVDALRDGYNVTYKWLEPNSSSAEQSTQPVADVDFLSNGFKMRGVGNTTNQSAGTYIYAAFAENPFQYARAR